MEEGVSGRLVQFDSRIHFHMRAMGRSQRAAILLLIFSFSHCSGSPDAKSARDYVRAARSGRGKGDYNLVRLAHTSSLSSRK